MLKHSSSTKLAIIMVIHQHETAELDSSPVRWTVMGIQTTTKAQMYNGILFSGE